jgi:hypothetical protein
MSATGTPSAPCFGMNAFSASEKLDAFVVPPSQGEIAAKDFDSKRSSFPGSDPVVCLNSVKAYKTMRSVPSAISGQVQLASWQLHL